MYLVQTLGLGTNICLYLPFAVSKSGTITQKGNARLLRQMNISYEYYVTADLGKISEANLGIV